MTITINMPEPDNIDDIKPFAGYENMDECIKDNQDKDDPAAYCAYLHHEATGEYPKGRRTVERKLITPNTLSAKGVEISTQEMDGKEFTTLSIPISSTSVDRDYDNFEPAAVNSMKEQLSTGKVGMFLDHGGENNQYPVLDMVGGFYDGEIDDDGVLYGKAFVDPDDDKAAALVKKIENNLPVGWSVGFADAKKSENEHGGYSIADCDLAEVSAVGIPSNPDAIVSFADTVAKRAAIQVKNLMQKEDDKMTEDKEEEPEEEVDEEDDESGDAKEDIIQSLADALDANPSAVMEALQEAGLLPKAEEDEDEEEDDKGLTLDDIRKVVREEVAKSMDPEPEEAEEDVDEPEDDKDKDPKVKKPMGKIVTPKEEDDKSSEPEDGENDGLKFNPNI